MELIKNTVAKGTTNDELEMFLYLAGQYGLDPFKKEIWCIKYDKNSAATIMTSRDGYLKIAQSNVDFDGIKSFVVREGDVFEIDAMGDQVTHKFGTKRGRIIGAWAIAYHKRLKPQICFVDFDEYNQGNSTWKKYPSAMIQKVAEAFVLKRQFGINGLVTQEEFAEPQFTTSDSPRTPHRPEAERAKQDFKTRWKEKINALSALAQGYGIDGDALREIGLAVVDKQDPTKWTFEDMDKLTEYLNADHQPPVDVEAREVETSGDEAEPVDGEQKNLLDGEELPF
ncbi:hypothetical protein GCM10025859_51680 [Alicyclobacillus fastidiosus]|nr:hypothetical protein GCM10025859_51680 [Alicyclobacillus fastidiosus]